MFHFVEYMAIRFLAEIFMVTQESIIYRLVMRNHDFDAFLKKSYLLRENGRGCHCGAKGIGAPGSNQRVGPLVGPYGSTTISKTCFQKNRV